jgi:hypothetical protein
MRNKPGGPPSGGGDAQKEGRHNPLKTKRLLPGWGKDRLSAALVWDLLGWEELPGYRFCGRRKIMEKAEGRAE